MTTVQTSTSSKPSQALLDAVNGSTSTSKSESEVAQDRFMTLLVTQMKNQDPLNPLDNAQVTSQLAQLSTVTGIDKLNSTMQTLINSVQSSQSYQASSMLGREVLVPGNKISLQNESGIFAVELPVGTEKLSISIQDSKGNVVRDLTLGKQASGIVPVEWDGYANDGSQMADGTYTYSIKATSAGNDVTANQLSIATVTSISNQGNSIKLNLSNLDSVSTDDVREIY